MATFVPDKAVSRSTRKGGGVFVPDHVAKPQAKRKGSRFGPVVDILGRGAGDLYHAAVNMPAGLYYTGEAVARDISDAAGRAHVTPGRPGGSGEKHKAKRKPAFKRSRDIGKQIVQATAEDLRHPLRHPGYTALDILGLASLGAGTAARGAAAAGAVGRGAKAGEVASIVARGPKPTARTFKVGDLEVKTPASRSALTRTGQRAQDKVRQGRAAKHPEGRMAGWETRKAEKALTEQLRHEEALAKAPAAALNALGRKLKHDQWMALRVVAEEAPLSRRITATRARMEEATSRVEKRRHAKRLRALEGARKHIGDADGKPALTNKRLQHVYDRMEKVAGSREKLGKKLGILTDDQIRGRKTAAGRVAMGATYEKPTPGKLGIPSPALEGARKRVAKLEARYERELGKARKKAGAPEMVRVPGTAKTRPRTAADVEKRIGELEPWLNDRIARVYKYLRSSSPTRNQGKDTRPRREQSPYEKERGGSYQVGGGSFIDKDYKPIREVVGKDADWGRAEETIYRRGKAEGAHPTVREIADRMDELDELKKLLVTNKEAPVFGTKAPGFGSITGKGSKAQQVPSDIPPLGTFGPKVTRVGGALSIARDQLEGMERAANNRVKRTGIIGAEDFEASPGAVYVPDIEQRFGRRGKISAHGAQGSVGEPRSPIRYGYTGESKRTAREPLKTTQAVAEAQLAVAKYARLVVLREKLKKAASPTPRRDDDIAIRLDNLSGNKPLPADARAFIDDPESLATLSPDEQLGKFEELRKNLIVGRHDKEVRQLSGDQLAEFQRLSDEGLIGWVPKQLLGDLAKPHMPLQGTLGPKIVGGIDAVNNATKMSVLYLKTAYAVPNLLGNAALNVIQQGFAAPRNLMRSVKLNHELGPELTAMVDTAMHEGFATALRGEQGVGAHATQTAANIWGKVVDMPFRRSSFLHEAGRSGFKTKQQIDRLFNDPALHDDLLQVMTRANREIIDYGRLSTREREVIRRVIFFYPWVKGSTMYAGNMLLEHPIKSAVGAQVGRMGFEESNERLGRRPSYLEGAIGTPWGLSNPTAASIHQTPAQVGATIAAVLSGRRPEVAELSDMSTPALALALNYMAGRNLRTGRQYPRSASGGLDIAKDTLLTGLPQYRLYQQLSGTSPAELFPPSPRTGLQQYGIGGIFPRPYNKRRLRELGRREQRELNR